MASLIAEAEERNEQHSVQLKVQQPNGLSRVAQASNVRMWCSWWSEVSSAAPRPACATTPSLTLSSDQSVAASLGGEITATVTTGLPKRFWNILGNRRAPAGAWPEQKLLSLPPGWQAGQARVLVLCLDQRRRHSWCHKDAKLTMNQTQHTLLSIIHSLPQEQRTFRNKRSNSMSSLR
jgi:hypothetical protein